MEPANQEEYDKVASFEDMGLDDNLLRGIYAFGFDIPSTIQQMAIKPIRDGRDVIAQAQSGTGKTGAFIISTLSMIDKRLHEPQVLILAPTRELAIQIYNNAVGLNVFSKLDIGILIGGNDQNINLNGERSFSENSQMVIGTPGKVFYMMNKHYLRTDNLKVICFDEADEMLTSCFKDQLYEIFRFIPKQAQVCIFSATITEDTLDLTNKFMNNPLKLLVKKEELTLEGIVQYYINVSEEQFKFEVLADIYRFLNINQTIIYCNSKKKCQQIHARLQQNNFTVSSIHSDMNQQERNAVIQKFRMGNVRILLATDIIARGIDVQQVSTVINFDLPSKKEIYIHRIGRSGRFGRKGMAINFVTKHDFNYLKQIENFYATTIEAFPDPQSLNF
jgi:translation initiation factor 4A